MTSHTWSNNWHLNKPGGRFISTSSVVFSVNILIPKLPERGVALRAQSAVSVPGGGYTTLSVVAAQGVTSCLASPLGTGPNSYAVRKRLSGEGITALTDVLVGDIGVALVLLEEDGSTTTVITPGVESEPTLASLEAIDLHEGDLIHINGADLSSPLGAEALATWGNSLPDSVSLVLSVSPAVDEVPSHIWVPLLERADIITMNIREASRLTAILDSASPGTGIRHILRPESAVVRRLGVMGCEVQQTLETGKIILPAMRATRADTAGVGDTHVATMCAGLLQGRDLVDACQQANAAAAIMVSRESTFPVPTPEEINSVLESGSVH